MNKEHAEKWIAALRSGEYKQGTLALYRPVTDCYCCLGVLNKLYPDIYCQLPGTESIRPGGHFRGSLGEISCSYPDANGEEKVTLAGLNDGGLTFDEIADIIEKEYPNL